MRWYEGDIAQAVSMSKQKNAIFVVYVEGKDDKSTNLTSLINNGDVSSKLESDQFVAIKVEAGSVSHSQFAAIYKNVPVPSIYFIGKNGKPIDIIVDSTSNSDLSERISSIIQTHAIMSPNLSQSVTSYSVSSNTVSQTASNSVSQAPDSTTVLQNTNTKATTDLIQNEQAASSTVEEKPGNVKCENGVCHRVDTTSNIPNNEETEPSATSENKENENSLSTEEKIERAKELVEITREMKKKEEEEKERLKEIERRKTGQDVQKLRRWQQDQELKNLMEERQRAKNEEKAARDRILAQIAQDKADRAARFGRSPPPATAQPETTQRSPNIQPSNGNSARLQFRLPDGSSRTENFQSNDTLQVVRDYVMENMNLPFKNFSMSTTFPRREFTSDDLDTSLRELELCPNAVILILPATAGSPVVAAQGGGFMSLIWFLLSPILGVFGYFRNLIFGATESVSSENVPEKNKRSNGDTDPPQQPSKRKATESTVVRRQGTSNIHRLSDRTDSDEDNNTWNGNSTQQM